MCDALESGGGPPHSRTLARETTPLLVAEATMGGSGHHAAMSPPASSGRNVGRAMERARPSRSFRRYYAARTGAKPAPGRATLLRSPLQSLWVTMGVTGSGDAEE